MPKSLMWQEISVFYLKKQKTQMRKVAKSLKNVVFSRLFMAEGKGFRTRICVNIRFNNSISLTQIVTNPQKDLSRFFIILFY